MRNSLLVLIVSVVLLQAMSCQPTYKLPKGAEDPKLQDVVTMVQDQYRLAIDSLNKSGITDFKIAEADVVLKVCKKASGAGDITVLIAKPSGKFIRTSTSTVTYALTTKPNPLGGGGAKKADNNLRDAIVSTITNFHNLNLQSGLDQLTKDYVILDMDFSIEIDASLALSFKIWGLGTDVSAESDHTVDHDLKLKFKYVGANP